MANAPTLYAFDPDTGLLLGTCEADPSPLEQDVWLHPAYTTAEVPPAAAANEACVFQNGAWSKVPDYRGKKYWLADGSEHEITALNVSPPAGALDVAPATPLSTLQADASVMVDSAAEEQRLKYITGGAGQAETYRIKADEAKAFIAAGRPADSSPYPIITAEAVAVGSTVSDLADLVVQTLATWTAKAAAIEAARRKGKVDISACAATDSANPTAAEAKAVSDARDAALTAISAL